MNSKFVIETKRNQTQNLPNSIKQSQTTTNGTSDEHNESCKESNIFWGVIPHQNSNINNPNKFLYKKNEEPEPEKEEKEEDSDEE